MKNLESYDLEVLSKNEQANVSGGGPASCIAIGVAFVVIGLLSQ